MLPLKMITVTVLNFVSDWIAWVYSIGVNSTDYTLGRFQVHFSLVFLNEEKNLGHIHDELKSDLYIWVVILKIQTQYRKESDKHFFFLLKFYFNFN